MKYLGDIEEYLGHKDPNTVPKNKNGYAVFNFRMSEKELEVLALLLDFYRVTDKHSLLYDLNGNNIGEIIRGMRRGIRQARRDLEKDKNELQSK